MYQFLKETQSARFLGMTCYELRRLRKRGRGPHHHELPNGDIRYRADELERWALSEDSVIQVDDRKNLVPFPGVTVRLIRRKLLPVRKGEER